MALETPEIYDEMHVAQVRRIASTLQDGLRRFADHMLVGEARSDDILQVVGTALD